MRMSAVRTTTICVAIVVWIMQNLPSAAATDLVVFLVLFWARTHRAAAAAGGDLYRQNHRRSSAKAAEADTDNLRKWDASAVRIKLVVGLCRRPTLRIVTNGTARNFSAHLAVGIFQFIRNTTQPFTSRLLHGPMLPLVICCSLLNHWVHTFHGVVRVAYAIGPLCVGITLSTKPEAYNVLQLYKRKIEPRSQRAKIIR